MTPGHECLTTDWLLIQFSQSRMDAYRHYRKFVSEGARVPSPLSELKNQVYLGSKQFVEDALGKLDPNRKIREVPRVQVLVAKRPLEHFENIYIGADLTMVIAYLSEHYTLEELGAHYVKGRSTVSRRVKAYELGKWET
jgi:putative transposase